VQANFSRLLSSFRERHLCANVDVSPSSDIVASDSSLPAHEQRPFSPRSLMPGNFAR